MAKSHPGACEIRTVRLLPFPRKLVFSAWADKELLARWWPDHGFNRTFHMKEDERIEFEHKSEPRFMVIVNFVSEFQKTKVTLRMMFKTPKECDEAKKYLVAENETVFDRLEEILRGLK
jgi:hypothetical protein